MAKDERPDLSELTVGSQTYHEKLISDGYKPEQLLHFASIRDLFPRLHSLRWFESGLVDMTVLPIELVPEAKEKFPDQDSEDCYVLYLKNR